MQFVKNFQPFMQAGAGDHLGLNASLPATCFPTAAGVANSWDEVLGEEIGEHLRQKQLPWESM